jgi:hypothetical protein
MGKGFSKIQKFPGEDIRDVLMDDDLKSINWKKEIFGKLLTKELSTKKQGFNSRKGWTQATERRLPCKHVLKTLHTHST